MSIDGSECIQTSESYAYLMPGREMCLFTSKGPDENQTLSLSVYLYNNFYVSYRFLFLFRHPMFLTTIGFSLYDANFYVEPFFRKAACSCFV